MEEGNARTVANRLRDHEDRLLATDLEAPPAAGVATPPTPGREEATGGRDQDPGIERDERHHRLMYHQKGLVLARQSRGGRRIVGKVTAVIRDGHHLSLTIEGAHPDVRGRPSVIGQHINLFTGRTGNQ